MSTPIVAVGIDPDTKNSGIAVVSYDDGEFTKVEVALARAKGRLAKDRRLAMSNALWQAIEDLQDSMTFTRVGVIEWQALRPVGERRPNNIVDLCGVAGMAVTALSRNVSSTVSIVTPTPGEWTKGIPKEVRANRVMRRMQWTDLERLTAGGIPASLQHHVLDAIGLAIWGIDLARRGELPLPLPLA